MLSEQTVWQGFAANEIEAINVIGGDWDIGLVWRMIPATVLKRAEKIRILHHHRYSGEVGPHRDHMNSDLTMEFNGFLTEVHAAR